MLVAHCPTKQADKESIRTFRTKIPAEAFIDFKPNIPGYTLNIDISRKPG
jgi:hypothetical protein